MGGDAFKRATPGGKLEIPAAAWNACLDAAEANRRKGGDGEPITQTRQADIVLVKNTSGADVGRFGVLGIDGVVFTPTDSLSGFQERFALRGTTPALPAHAGKFVVCLEPIAAGKVGRAYVSGTCAVQVDMRKSDDAFCTPIAGDRAKLRSGAQGTARILYRESNAAGVTWCVVRLGDASPTLRRFRLTEPLYACGSAIAEELESTAHAEGAAYSLQTRRDDAGAAITFTVRDPLGRTGVDSCGYKSVCQAEAGTLGIAWWAPEAAAWEVVAYGRDCGSSSSSQSSSSSSSSQSSSSSSQPSSSSSQPSSSASQSSSTSDSGSGSQPPPPAGCEDIEVVTNVECVNGAIVVTKTTIRVMSCQS